MSLASREEGPFMSYNKVDDVPTLVGNWVEERALKDLTGVTRTLGASLARGGASPSRPPAGGDAIQATHPRVIEHPINQVHPADWRSHTQAAFQDPQQQQAQGLAAYAQTAGAGPRERMLLAELMREARDVPPEVMATVRGGMPIPYTYESTYRAELKPHDLTGMQVGARVMRDLDGRADTIKRDPTFLAEHRITDKHLADRVFGDTARQAGARDTSLLANPDVPVTIYSEAVANKTYGGTFSGTAALNSASPFGKTTNFSKPMGDYSKVVIDE